MRLAFCVTFYLFQCGCFFLFYVIVEPYSIMRLLLPITRGFFILFYVASRFYFLWLLALIFCGFSRLLAARNYSTCANLLSLLALILCGWLQVFDVDVRAYSMWLLVFIFCGCSRLCSVTDCPYFLWLFDLIFCDCSHLSYVAVCPNSLSLLELVLWYHSLTRACSIKLCDNL